MTPDQRPGAETETPCQSAKELLGQVAEELAKFEAKKLNELKTELDAFVKTQDALVTEYKNKFPSLRKLWCDRQLDVERLCAHIKCEFPETDEKWKKLIEKCICEKMHDLCCLGQRIDTRKKCSSGPLQRARDEAAAAFDAAKKRLEWVKDLSKRLEAVLADNLKLVGEIEKVPATERPIALYLFRFKLQPSHLHLAPYDASEECLKVCSETNPNKLCCDVYGKPCPEDDTGCTPKDPKWADACKKIAEPDGPWLMSPDNYRNALDCAWQAYRKAKDVLAEKEAALKQVPDDLESLIKKYTRDAIGLEDAIKKCLKDSVTLQDECCKQTEPKKGEC